MAATGKKKLKGGVIINADELGFCRTYDISTNSLMFVDEIAILVDKESCALSLEHLTFYSGMNSA